MSKSIALAQNPVVDLCRKYLVHVLMDQNIFNVSFEGVLANTALRPLFKRFAPVQLGIPGSSSETGYMFFGEKGKCQTQRRRIFIAIHIPNTILCNTILHKHVLSFR